MYQDQHCSIGYQQSKALLYLQWLKQPDLKALLKAYDICVNLAIRTQASCVVVDNSLGISLDLSMQRALAELSARRLPETKILRVARVVPQDVFQELVTHRIHTLIHELGQVPVEIELFSNAVDATCWATATGTRQAIA